MNESSLAGVYTDFQGLGKLRASARQQTPDATRETAEQFEALFIQTMLKSMRQATPGDPLLGSDQADMYRDMMDQQLAIDLSKRGGIGLADIIERQLNPSRGNQPAQTSSPYVEHSMAFASRLWNGQTTSSIPAAGQAVQARWKDKTDFIQSLLPAAESAATRLGTKAEAVLAVAALETGWGQHIIPASNGQSSFNLFGIKAAKNSRQGHVMANTLEFENGAMQKRREPFRRYNSPAESVADFASFVQQNPRYSEALKVADDPEQFLRGLHKAGYATDPNYSQKVLAVMHRIQDMTQETITVADKRF